MNNLLIAIGVIIVTVLSALFAVPYFVDWNSYRGVIEEEASRLIGRDVRIGGDITAQLLPSPAFAIQKLRVADISTDTGEPLFRADRFDVRLSIVPLFRGVLEASQIELVRPDLRLLVDDAGQGNWRSLVQKHGSLPFAPSVVALQSVKITDGTVGAFDQRGARERLRIDHVEGQLSAPALEGPYRFRGTFGAANAVREVRFTTLPPDAEGSVQLKATLKDDTSGATASFDGRLRNLTGQPELSGDLTAQLPLASGSEAAAKAQPRPVAELKAALSGTHRQIALNNMSLAFESSGRPEVLTGGATFNFDGDLRTVANLSAPWIDLDNVLGNPKGGAPLIALADFAQIINGLGTRLGNATVSLNIEQANLGHELVSGLRIDARSTSGVMALEQVRASLPGGTKVEILGRLAGEGGGTTFDGDLTLRGSSLARLAAWATAGGTVIEPANDLSFQMKARLTAEPARGGLRNIVATIGDSALEGEIDYAWKGPRVLRMSIGGPRIDARIVVPTRPTLRTLAAAMAPAGRPSADDLTVALSLRTAELVLGSQTLRDVATNVESSPQGLSIEQLQFSGEHGVAVSLAGRLGGTLRGSLAAADAEGLSSLSEFIDFPLSPLLPSALKADAFPLRFAGTLTSGSSSAPKSVNVAADGRAGDIDAKIKLALTEGLDSWRIAPIDLDVVLLAPARARLAGRVLEALRGLNADQPKDIVAAALAGNADKAKAVTRLAVRAVGVPADGLSTAARFDSPDVGILLDGQSSVASSGQLQLAGDLTIEARDSRDIVDAAGGLDLALAEPLAMQGTLHLNARDTVVSLTKIALSTSTNTISGRLSLEPASGKEAEAAPASQRLRGELALGALDAQALLAPVLQARPREAQAAIQVTSGRVGAWPDANFNLARSSGIVTDIGLKVGTLVIANGVALGNAEFRYLSRPGALEVRDLTGTALGGRATFSGVLDRTQTGAALTARLNVEGADMVNFGGTGTADLSLTLTGGGLNPAGLVSSLGGSGTLTLKTSSVREINPATLQAAIETTFKAAPDKLDSTLRSALGEDAARGPVSLGPRTIALVVSDGAVRFLPITLQVTPGRITTQAQLDLATFQISGDWRVETRLPPLPPLPPLPGQPAAPPAPTPAAMLPALVQRFAIAPTDLSSTPRSRQPAPETSALERELAVRKVERDLAELERIRRLDEERAAAAKAAAEQAEWARQMNIQQAPVPQPVPAAPTPVPATRP